MPGKGTHPESSEAEHGVKPKRRPAVFIAAVIALVCLTGSYTLEFAFYRLEVFRQDNVLFDTDICSRVIAISHGWSGYGRSYAHPNLSNFFSPPIRLLGKAVHATGLARTSEREI